MTKHEETQRVLKIAQEAQDSYAELRESLLRSVRSTVKGLGREVSLTLQLYPDHNQSQYTRLSAQLGASFLEDMSLSDMKEVDLAVEKTMSDFGFGRTSIEESRIATRWKFDAFSFPPSEEGSS